MFLLIFLIFFFFIKKCRKVVILLSKQQHTFLFGTLQTIFEKNVTSLLLENQRVAATISHSTKRMALLNVAPLKHLAQPGLISLLCQQTVLVFTLVQLLLTGRHVLLERVLRKQVPRKLAIFVSNVGIVVALIFVVLFPAKNEKKILRQNRKKT